MAKGRYKTTGPGLILFGVRLVWIKIRFRGTGPIRSGFCFWVGRCCFAFLILMKMSERKTKAGKFLLYQLGFWIEREVLFYLSSPYGGGAPNERGVTALMTMMLLLMKRDIAGELVARDALECVYKMYSGTLGEG